MANAFKEFLEELKGSKEILAYNEAETKQAVVQPILHFLGWNPAKPDEVKPEYSVSGRRVDYALRLDGACKVFIEVKRIDENLEDHQEQLLAYAFSEGVRMAALTNGITWWLYLPLLEGVWEKRKFFAIDILDQDSSTAEASFEDFLSRAAIATGDGVRKAEAVLEDRKTDTIIKKFMPKAWEKMLQEPDPLLVELLKETTEKMCGREPTDESVADYLQKKLSSVLPPSAGSTFPQSQPRPPRPPQEQISTYPPAQPNRPRTSLKVMINWERDNKALRAEVYDGLGATDAFLRVLNRLGEIYGQQRFDELATLKVNRGPLLSSMRTRYHRKHLMGWFVNVNNSTSEKKDILQQAARHLQLPAGLLTIDIVE